MRACPICQSDSDHAVWPYLKGVVAGGEALTWWRCSHCAALFSDLTQPGARRSYPVQERYRKGETAMANMKNVSLIAAEIRRLEATHRADLATALGVVEAELNSVLRRLDELRRDVDELKRKPNANSGAA